MSTLLKTWREANGLTLTELAAVSGYSVAMLSRVERGERNMSAVAKVQMARALGVPVRRIFPVVKATQPGPVEESLGA